MVVLKLTDQGLMQAAIIFCRFILIIFYSTILTVTTTPLSLADAVEKILTPLKIIKVPAHENWVNAIYEFALCSNL